jgi:hypothetical protein
MRVHITFIQYILEIVDEWLIGGAVKTQVRV